MIKHLALATLALSLPLIPAVLGCSSSSSGGTETTGDDASTAHDTGTTDSSTTHDGGATDSAAHDSAAADTSTGDDGSTGTCPAPTTGYTGTTYAPVTATLGVCGTDEINAFIAACGDQGTNDLCNAWLNPTTDAGAATACGICIEGSSSTQSNGAAYFDVNMNLAGPNYGACVQLTDATHGTACGTAINNGIDCNATACGMCADQTTYDTCVMGTTATGGGCVSFASAEQTACASDTGDAGAIATCTPGAATNTQDPDWTYIINLICGTGQ